MLVQRDDIRYPIIGVTTQLKSSSNLTSVHSDCKKTSWIPSWTKNIEIVLSSWKALESTSWCLHQPFCGHMFRIPQHIRPSYDGMYPPSILVTDDSGKCDCHSQWIFESTWKIWPQVLTHKSALTGGIQCFTLTLLEFLAPLSIALASPSDTQQVTPPHDQSRLQRLHTLQRSAVHMVLHCKKKHASIPKPSHGLTKICGTVVLFLFHDRHRSGYSQHTTAYCARNESKKTCCAKISQQLTKIKENFGQNCWKTPVWCWFLVRGWVSLATANRNEQTHKHLFNWFVKTRRECSTTKTKHANWKKRKNKHWQYKTEFKTSVATATKRMELRTFFLCTKGRVMHHLFTWRNCPRDFLFWNCSSAIFLWCLVLCLQSFAHWPCRNCAHIYVATSKTTFSTLMQWQIR